MNIFKEIRCGKCHRLLGRFRGRCDYLEIKCPRTRCKALNIFNNLEGHEPRTRTARPSESGGGSG